MSTCKLSIRKNSCEYSMLVDQHKIEVKKAGRHQLQVLSKYGCQNVIDFQYRVVTEDRITGYATRLRTVIINI